MNFYIIVSFLFLIVLSAGLISVVVISVVGDGVFNLDSVGGRVSVGVVLVGILLGWIVWSQCMLELSVEEVDGVFIYSGEIDDKPVTIFY